MPEFIAGSAVLPFQSSQIVVAPLRDHVAPARVVGLRGDRVGEVGPAVVGEHRISYWPPIRPVPMWPWVSSLDLVDEVVEDRAAARPSGTRPKRQRQHAGGLRAVVVLAELAVEELRVEGGGELVGVLGEALRVVRLAEQRGVPLHQPQVVVEIGRGQQRFVRHARRILRVDQRRDPPAARTSRRRSRGR